MKVKAENPIRFLDSEEAPPTIAAYYEICHLKQLYRQGWLRRGVPAERCESVADHSFAMILLTLWLAPTVKNPPLDVDKAVNIAILHEIGEVYAGDIIPADEISPEEKHRLEEESVRTVFARLPQGAEYHALWEEYEAGATPEARFVRQVDRLEMAMQASVYHRQGMPGMEEFFTSTRAVLSDPGLLELWEKLIND